MRLLSRTLFREVFASAVLGSVLFTSVVYLYVSRDLFRFVVENPGPPEVITKLFLLGLPQTLPYTIPLGVLVGVLLALGRKTSDGEITAMRAAGIPGWRVVRPVLLFAFLGMSAAAASSLWLAPWAVHEGYRLENVLLERHFKAEVKAMEFEERFPNTVLFVLDIRPGQNNVWRQLFMADVTQQADHGGVPVVTLAQQAIAQPDPENNRVQVSLRQGLTYQANKEVEKYEVQSFPSSDQALQAQRRAPKEPAKRASQMDPGPLYRVAYKHAEVEGVSVAEARMELHQRLTLPFASISLALAGLPLVLSSRRRGKSPAVVLTVMLAFLYYMGFIGMFSLARQGTLPIEVALWLPNAVALLLGGILLGRTERPGRRDYIDVVTGWFRRPARGLTVSGKKPGSERAFRWEWRRLPLFPQVIDAHLTGRFLFYFFLWLATFILLLDVFTFFELLGDIIRNNISMGKVMSYLFFLTPRWIYELTPVSVLTSVLVVLGILSKDNEVTAFKACGISVYRLAVPLLFTSLLLSGGLFAFNHYVVPSADRRQDQLRAEIKNSPAQTFLNPGEKWVWGLRPEKDGDYYRVYHYRYYDKDQMTGVNVFEIDPKTWRLYRHITAEAARWEEGISSWVFQNGWSRKLSGIRVEELDNFAGQTRTFHEIKEDKEYFSRVKIQPEQMNETELAEYIEELKKEGPVSNNDSVTVPLRVDYFKKFAVPLFAFILALVSAPFGLGTGTRGAMAGIGISFAIYIAYVSVQRLFEELGKLSQLPPDIAAWSPDVIFALAGLYFLIAGPELTAGIGSGSKPTRLPSPRFPRKMRTYKLTLEYDGSKYSGWQDQANARTVQGELKQAAAELFGAVEDVQGAGRTDAGVHAVGQVAHVKLARAPKLTPAEILLELNDRLPSSVAVLECEEAPPRFHARHHAVARAYFYQISTRKAALSKRYVWWVKQPLDVKAMQKLAALIPGRHDFAAFRAADKSKPDESTIVVVESAEVAVDDHLIVFRIEASHFLWKMVRRLTGVLVKAGLGEVSEAEFRALLEGKKNPRMDVAAWTAPGSGLFLESVRY